MRIFFGLTVASYTPLISLLLLSPGSLAQNPQPNDTPATADTWVDATHEGISNRADLLANWADGFFGNPQYDVEAASTIIRVRPQWEWDEQDDSDWKLRASGKVSLPGISKRTSLIFQNDESDPDADFYDPALATDGNATVGLQYDAIDEDNQRVDFTAALKSGFKGKLSTRYRYLLPFGKNNRFRFSEELFWIGGDGFGTLTRFSIDHSFSTDTLLRWANRAEYSEDSNGLAWNTRLAWLYKVSNRGALRLFGFVRGQTSPELLNSRGFGAGYRRQFLRKWLHWEIEPRYAWRKRKPDQEREGVASVSLRLEITFGND